MTPERIQHLRELALTYLDLATDGDNGRGESDPIYKAITEGRDFGAGYSSCGDLCHWLLYRLGVRASWLNRDEAHGWQVGKNISRLAWQCKQTRRPTRGDQYEPGDILIHWNDPNGTDAHVFVVRRQQGDHIYSADMGQPGAARRMRFAHQGLLGGKQLQRVIPLDAVLLAESARGALAPPEDAEAWMVRALRPGRRPVLRLGSTGEAVAELQRRLGGLEINGVFGQLTRARVLALQKAHGLKTDGVVGELTWGVLP